MSVVMFPGYPGIEEMTQEMIDGVYELCRTSDRACRGLDLSVDLTDVERHQLKEFRRHLVNFSRARAYGSLTTNYALTKLGGAAMFGDARLMLQRVVTHGFYEAQHMSTTDGYITVGGAVTTLQKMGLIASERTIRSMIRDQVEDGIFQELQTSRDQRLRHIIPSYDMRLVFEVGSTIYCLCVARFERSALGGAMQVETIASLADDWLSTNAGCSFLTGKVPPHSWDNRVVGLLDIDEEDNGDNSDPEAVGE